MFLLRVSSPGPVDDDEPDRDMPPGPKEPRRSVADTSERRPRVPPEDILLEIMLTIPSTVSSPS